MGGRWENLGQIPVLSLGAVAEQAEAAHKKGQQYVRFRELHRAETEPARQLVYHRQNRENRAMARQIAEKIPGYAAVTDVFHVLDTDRGNYMDMEGLVKDGTCLLLTLQRRASGHIDQLDWFVPLDKEKPRFDGSVFLKQAALLEHLLGKFTWLANWKGASSGRALKTSLYGEVFISPEGTIGAPKALWLKKGLQGSPCAELTLWRSDRTWIELAIGTAENRSLIFSAPFFPKSDKERLAHPLDSLKRDEAKDGVVVDTQGMPTESRSRGY